MGIVFGRVSEEQPAYATLASTAEYQVRRYPSQLAAAYAGAADTGTAFRALASYCGITTRPKQVEDDQKTPISMTAPVLMEVSPAAAEAAAGGNGSSASSGSVPRDVDLMAFFLPAKFTGVENAPKPLDPAVKIIQLPERTVAVVTFNGNSNSDIVRKKAAELKMFLARDGIVVNDDKLMLAAYNPPFTIPYLKTNEVMLSVDPASVPTRL